MSLKEKVLLGTKWIALANLFKQVMRVFSLIIFARLLTPSDFGIFSILLIFVNFLIMFVDMGTSAALIQIKKTSQKLLSSIFYFNILIGIFLSIVLSLSSNMIADFFNKPILTEYIPLISINFIIMSLIVVQKAKFEKELNVKYVVLSESIAILLGIVIALVSAYNGLGVYSLIWQTLSTSLFTAIFIWMSSSWYPSLFFSFSEIKKIWRYTTHLSIFNLINYFSRNIDNILIGKFLNSSALGVYSLAYSIMLYPLQNISRVLIRILFPAFSKIQDNNEKFKNAYLKVIFFISLVTFPLMVGLMSTADLFVDVVFGKKWEDLAQLLIILSPVGMIQAIGGTNGTIYMAKGNTGLLLKVGIFSTIVTVIGFGIGIFWDITGVALSFLISNIILLYPIFTISWKQIDLKFIEGIRVIFPVLIISILMGISILFVQKILLSLNLSTLIQLTLSILFGTGVYISLLHVKYGSLKVLIKDLKKNKS